jgi:hypothetical protein
MLYLQVLEEGITNLYLLDIETYYEILYYTEIVLQIKIHLLHILLTRIYRTNVVCIH